MNTVWTAVGVYAALLSVLFVMQRSLLYPSDKTMPDPSRAGMPGIQAVTTETGDGLRLTHWYRPPATGGAPVLVVFHGNAGHVGDRVPKLSALMNAGLGVLLAGYRGYGGNPGSPSEEALTADARLLLDWLEEQGIGPERTVLYGESLGTGIAVKLAVERPVAAVILESPYTSIAEVAQAHYWYLPARWLVLDKWDSLSRIGGLATPLLVIHGAQDRTVPTRYGRQLFEAAPEPKEFLLLDRAAHNDIYEFPQTAERVIEFLSRHAQPAGG